MDDGDKKVLTKDNHDKSKTGINSREQNANVYKATALSRETSGSSSDALLKSIDELASLPPGSIESAKMERKISKMMAEEKQGSTGCCGRSNGAKGKGDNKKKASKSGKKPSKSDDDQ